MEQPTAGLQVLFQLIQLELYDSQSLYPAFRFGQRGLIEVGFDLALGFGDRLDQKPHVLVGILDSVKRCLEGTVQGREFLKQMGSLAERVGFEPTIPVKVCPVSYTHLTMPT